MNRIYFQAERDGCLEDVFNSIKIHAFCCMPELPQEGPGRYDHDRISKEAADLADEYLCKLQTRLSGIVGRKIPMKEMPYYSGWKKKDLVAYIQEGGVCDCVYKGIDFSLEIYKVDRWKGDY